MHEHDTGMAVALIIMVTFALLLLMWMFTNPADNWRNTLAHDLYMVKQCASANGNCVVTR